VNTLYWQGGMIGPPTCGTGPGATIGQAVISLTLAAGFPIDSTQIQTGSQCTSNNHTAGEDWQAVSVVY